MSSHNSVHLLLDVKSESGSLKINNPIKKLFSRQRSGSNCIEDLELKNYQILPMDDIRESDARKIYQIQPARFSSFDRNQNYEHSEGKESKEDSFNDRSDHPACDFNELMTMDRLYNPDPQLDQIANLDRELMPKHQGITIQNMSGLPRKMLTGKVSTNLMNNLRDIEQNIENPTPQRKSINECQKKIQKIEYLLSSGKIIKTSKIMMRVTPEKNMGLSRTVMFQDSLSLYGSRNMHRNTVLA